MSTLETIGEVIGIIILCAVFFVPAFMILVFVAYMYAEYIWPMVCWLGWIIRDLWKDAGDRIRGKT